ncbi:MAG: sigma-70 family RNA polymerase sigma factor [Saprospiraceae bacterium]
MIDRLQQGDNAAFEYLYDHYAATMFGIIKRIVTKEEDAENLLQDCFVKIWRYIGTYEVEKGSLATWLINIARNTAIDHTRSKHFIRETKNQNLDSLVSIESRVLSVSQQEDTLDLRQLVLKIDPSCRKVLEWMYFDGLTQQEISEEYGLPLGTVKTRARNGLRELRELFEQPKPV